MSRLYDSMIRRVEETRAVQLNDYGFHDRNVLYGKLRELRKQKEKKDITEEEKRIIDIQIMRLQNLIDTMDQNAAKRREGEYVDVPEIDVDDKFDTLSQSKQRITIWKVVFLMRKWSLFEII